MMNVLNFISHIVSVYGLDVLIILIFIISCAYLLKKGKKDLVRQMCFALVVQAEKQLGSKTGVMKRAVVITELYSKLPFIIRILFSKQEIENMIDGCLEVLKRMLRTPGVDLNGYENK